jgi:hypothetical protein
MLIIGDIQNLDMEESFVYLKTIGKHLEIDIDKFYSKAMEFKITK